MVRVQKKPASRVKIPRIGKENSGSVFIPDDRNETVLDFAGLGYDGRKVKLTNLRKPFWPELGITELPSTISRGV